MGIAQETVNGGLVRVAMEGVVSMNCESSVGIQANVGKGVVLTDDNTVAVQSGSGVRIGVITKIESTTSVRVKLNTGLASA